MEEKLAPAKDDSNEKTTLVQKNTDSTELRYHAQDVFVCLTLLQESTMTMTQPLKLDPAYAGHLALRAFVTGS